VRIVRITNDGAQTKDNEGKQKYFGDHFFRPHRVADVKRWDFSIACLGRSIVWW